MRSPPAGSRATPSSRQCLPAATSPGIWSRGEGGGGGGGGGRDLNTEAAELPNYILQAPYYLYCNSGIHKIELTYAHTYESTRVMGRIYNAYVSMNLIPNIRRVKIFTIFIINTDCKFGNHKFLFA